MKVSDSYVKQTPSTIVRAARRLAKNGDFQDLMTYMTNEQAVVCLNMDVNNKDQLQLARVYYDALSIVPELVANIAKEADQENG